MIGEIRIELTAVIQSIPMLFNSLEGSELRVCGDDPPVLQGEGELLHVRGDIQVGVNSGFHMAQPGTVKRDILISLLDICLCVIKKQ